jgi:pyridoxamine 5'-phosphate oxidase
VQFRRWFDQAVLDQGDYAESMTVSTAGLDGMVTSRQALLKLYDQRGFCFFTNYQSRKSQQISENPHVAICFFWSILQRQVRIEGVAVRTTEEESDTYFASRPRGSQLGAWASMQSQVLVGGRGDLDARFEELEKLYSDKPVPRPPHWGGFRVIPTMIEFWQGRPDRLHDRFRYRLREPSDWIIERLSP